MICKVKAVIEKYSLLENVRTVAVGVSGGADSVCLLHILSCLKDSYGIILKAVHINHNLRGEEADSDEAFVRALCEKMGIEFRCFSVDVRAEAKIRGVGEEECGRLLRYECFAAVGCDAVAVAHSLSDSIETMLFNLARGTALKGLCSIPCKRSPNIIRPLIECTRGEIEEYCRLNGLDYVTDSTNLTCDYMRNHIRHKLIPDVAYINGSYERSIGRCMASLREDSDYLDSQAQKLLCESRLQKGNSIEVLLKAHPALRKRALAQLLRLNMKKDVEQKHIILFENALKSKTSRTEIGTGLYIFIKGDTVTVSQQIQPLGSWSVRAHKGENETPAGVYILSEGYGGDGDVIGADKLSQELYFSSRQPGDSFTLRSRGLTKSLRKLYNEMKIPAELRDSIAVLHDADKVVWVEGIGVNSPYLPEADCKNLITVKRKG